MASLWPLRDAEAAWLLERYYRHLAMGQGVSQALRSAQRDAWEDGQPAAAWAGLGVMGDAALVPVPSQAQDVSNAAALGWTWFLPALICALLGTAYWHWKRNASNR
ncbi:CHAT domain-containing protein [Corallococcus praedator]|uniref:CHAT domain-containing protein n=1 Tax=Corallococcus praedator TaxID=2316724 RepID=UPI001FC99BF2